METPAEEYFKWKEKHIKDLEDNLESICNQLKDMGALKIILFGSYAQGQVNPGSDLDIIAVMPDSMSGRRWINRIYEEIERNVDCDIVDSGNLKVSATGSGGF